MSKKPDEPIVFNKQRRVFFSKKSLDQELIHSQKEMGSAKQIQGIIGNIKSTPIIQEKTTRTKLKDEVEITFNPKKFTIINPSARFEFRRTKIQFKLKNSFSQQGQILVLFIDKGYLNNSDFIELCELCQYDIAGYLSQQKLGVGKVFPIISKNYENFEGCFIAMIDEHINRLAIAEVLKNVYEQVQQNDIDSIVIPMIKGFKNSQQMANIYIQQTVNFLLRSKKPPQQITITTDSNEKYKQLWRLFSDLLQKVGDFDNICLNRQKLYKS